MIANLESLLAGGRDDALIRFSLGNAYLGSGKAELAIPHLRAALAHDNNYSAAWKLLGKALEATGDPAQASHTYEEGIAIAEAKGDVQAAREMRVFLKRAGGTP